VVRTSKSEQVCMWCMFDVYRRASCSGIRGRGSLILVPATPAAACCCCYVVATARKAAQGVGCRLMLSDSGRASR
jgi:hypothetical protein